ncbi:hypothetical protein JX266_008344 [Neoarthrinium moseri]|nr:hypothetical protein JX266_008344 [Neoarthrinium moseri]
MPSDEQCRSALEGILDNLDSFHNAEYSASATMLTLLPTIGSMLGAPSADTWLLLKLVPFAGVFGLLLSYGSPIRMGTGDTYQDSFTIVGKDQQDGEKDSLSGGDYKKDDLPERVSSAVQANLMGNKAKLPISQLAWSILVMFLLFAGAMTSMVVVELATIYVTWCRMNWWFHLWYIALTIVAFAESYVNVPFRNYLTIYITEEAPTGLPEVPHSPLGNTMSAHSVKQTLTTLPKGKKYGSASYFSRNNHSRTIALVISKTHGVNEPAWAKNLRQGVQLFFKIGTLTIFVFGTSVLAAVVLLALPMAQMVLTLVVGSGAVGQFLIQKMADTVKKTGSSIHVIADSDEEAGAIVMRLLDDQVNGPKSFTMEVGDIVLARKAFVGRRSPWARRLLGLLAPPMKLDA